MKGRSIESLHKKADKIAEQKLELTETSELLDRDLEEIKGLLDEPLLDEDDVSAESYLEGAISSDLSSITSELQDNDSERIDALSETDDYISSLEDNLRKLEEIRSASDLGTGRVSSDSTERRLEKLREIRELLEGEKNASENTDTAADSYTLDSGVESSFRENIRFEIENTRYDYSLGILFTNANLSEEYKRILSNRNSSAEQNAKNAFSIAVQKGMIRVKDASWYDVPHYHPANDNRERGIYFNADVDEEDFRGRGKGAVFFHETGHMIDHVFGNGKCLSSTNEFRKALKKDAEAIIKKCNASSKWADGFYEMIRQDNTAHSISDIIEGITYGEVSGKYGHINGDSNYWNLDKYRVCNECFAHFFEASMGGGTVTVKAKGNNIEMSKIERLKLFFPNTYREFDRILTYLDDNFNSDPRQRERGIPDER